MTRHTPPTDVAPLAPQTVESSFHMLIARIVSLRPPRIVGEPDGDDLRGVSNHMVEIADAVDAYFEQIGRMVQSNAPVKIEQKLFRDPCFQAIAGNAIFEIARVAEALDQERVI